MEGLRAAGSPQLTPYQFSGPTWLIKGIYIVDLAESSQGRISWVKCGWDAFFSTSHWNQSNGDTLLGQAWVSSHPCDWMGWCLAHSNHRKLISQRKEIFFIRRKGKGYLARENRDPGALMVGQILLKLRQCLLMTNSQAYKIGKGYEN